MATISASLKTTVDAEFDTLVTDIASVQTTYKAANPAHWQGKACTATVPADGNTVSSTPTVTPTNLSADWSNINGASQGVTLSANLPLCMEVHSYDGPQGHGYIVSGTVVESGRTFNRVVNVGPETHKAHDWIDVTDPA